MNNTNYSSIEIHVFGDESSKEVTLTEHLLLPKNIRAVVGISHFVMPNNMYNIKEFQIEQDGSTHIIKSGFYNQKTLTSELLNNRASDNEQLELELTYDSISMRFTIKGGWNHLHLPKKNYMGITGTISGDQYYFDSNHSSLGDNAGIVGTKSPDLGGIPDIFIKLDGLEYPTVNKYKAIGRIPVDAGIGSYLNYNPSEIIYYLLSNQDILKFTVKLLDSNGDYVDINGADWSLTIVLHFQDKGFTPLPNFPTKACTTGLCLSDFKNTDRPISRDLYNELKSLRRKQKKLKKNCRSLF